MDKRLRQLIECDYWMPWACPLDGCGGDVHVYRTKETDDIIERVRECKKCGHKYTTSEFLNHPIQKKP